MLEIDSEFKRKVEKFKKYISNLAKEFKSFDINNQDHNDRINLVLHKKQEIFPHFDDFFRLIWDSIKLLDKKAYKLYQEYYQKALGDPLLDAEINKHIRLKPLGYPGDFMVMNYIYDYHDKLLGKSSLEMLINLYTTNIPISCSNIKRKEYFKRKIEELLSGLSRPSIASIGCGSARELIELIAENKINKPLKFSCVDFESQALDYVRNKIEQIDSANKKHLSVNYLQLDIRGLARNHNLQEGVGECDFIYVSGVLDYLGKHIAKRIVSVLFNILKNNGLLIIVNAGSKDIEFRSYYEFLGEWRFHHRSKEEMNEWVEDLNGVKSCDFAQFSFPMNYLFLLIRKK